MRQTKLNTLQLTDLMKDITEYGIKSGKYYTRSKKIYQDLKSADPFIVHQARLAACLILEDTLLYN
jgi:hypothetical protein